MLLKLSKISENLTPYIQVTSAASNASISFFVWQNLSSPFTPKSSLGRQSSGIHTAKWIIPILFSLMFLKFDLTKIVLFLSCCLKDY